MKKYIQTILFVALCFHCSIYAQIGMTGNSPNKDAVLDLNTTAGSATKGLLLPKIGLSSTNSTAPYSTHTSGMHVYNTNTAGSGLTQVTPGQYYNNGSSWIRVQPTGWSLQGNSDITASNFLGTTDATDLVIRTNNTEQIRFTSAGNILAGTTTVPTGGNNAKVILSNIYYAPAIQIKDGTQKNRYILTSDANGVGTWKPKPDNDVTYFAPTFGAGANLPATPGTWYYTGTSITLPAGRWLVNVVMLLQKGSATWTGTTESWWVNSNFSNSSSTLAVSTDVEDLTMISGLLPPVSPYGILSGSLVINNTSGANKTYYYMGKLFTTNGSPTGQIANFGAAASENMISWQKMD
jgi:hypothetical protein